jgi:hypothetical protein
MEQLRHQYFTNGLPHLEERRLLTSSQGARPELSEFMWSPGFATEPGQGICRGRGKEDVAQIRTAFSSFQPFGYSDLLQTGWLLPMRRLGKSGGNVPVSKVLKVRMS